VARTALPLLVYFGLTRAASFALGWCLRLGDAGTTAVEVTTASNNFELTIAVFGVTSGETLAGVIGPLIGLPVLVGLV
jgi:ACR3 family arsenite efflux pump ArsB